MKTIRCQIDVSLPSEELYDLTQDYDRRLEWDPYLVEAFLLGGAKEVEVGVQSYCKNKYGSSMTSRYISYERPRVAAVTMVKGPFLLKKFSGAWNIKAISKSVSTLVFTYNFDLKGGILGKLFLPIAVFLFKSEMKGRLLSIKNYVEKK